MKKAISKSKFLAVAVLGSGNGSNFQALADALDAGVLPIKFACVISDLPNAFILERAHRRNVPAFFVDPGPSRSRLDGDAEQNYIRCLREHGAELVVLAGFLRILKPAFLNAFNGRIVNIHPSLLPAFPGLDSWKQAMDYGAKITGCTVHFVDAGMDTGPVIMQQSVPIHDSDTPETLHARIQTQEHLIYPEAIRLIAEDRLRIEGRRVVALPSN